MLSRKPFVCPPELLKKAQALHPVATAVASAGSPLPMESARRSAEAGLLEPILVGNQRSIEAIAEEMSWDVSNLRIVSADGETAAAETAVALARSGEAAAVMKGQVHTDVLMRAVFNRDTGLRVGRRISHVFHMTIPERTGSLLITDAAVNVSPDVATKLDIIRNAVDVLHALGNTKPKVAILSATEQPNESVPSSVAAREVSRLAREQISDALIDGPFAFDNAMSPEAAAIKGIDSPVAGQADMVLVPNIETGNTLYKCMVFLMSATAAGIVVGTRVPVILTSRADPPEARLASAALAAIVSGHQK
jgi:phosphate acetyltransferase